MNIAYFPAGDRNFASSRMRCWRIADALRAAGHTCTGLLSGNLDAAVFQKRFDLNNMMEHARALGVRVVWDVDDMIANGPVDLADVVTVDTAAKLALYPNAIVVPDALDLDADAPRKSGHAEKLSRVVWVGNPENVYHIKNVAAACDALAIELVVITDLNSSKCNAYSSLARGVQWELTTVDREMIEADICVAPYIFDGEWGEQWVRAKSENRVVKAWGLGLPVAGTPIRSYVDAGLQHCAETVEEWTVALRALASRDARVADAARGYEIAQAYRDERVAERWLEVFKGNR